MPKPKTAQQEAKNAAGLHQLRVRFCQAMTAASGLILECQGSLAGGAAFKSMPLCSG